MKVNSITNSNQISKMTDREKDKPKDKCQPIMPYYIMTNRIYSSHYNSPKYPKNITNKKNNININIKNKKKIIKSNSTLSSYNHLYNNNSKNNLNSRKIIKNDINLNSVENSPSIKDKILSHSKKNFKSSGVGINKNKKKINWDCNLLMKKISNPNKQKSSNDIFYNDSNKNYYTLNTSEEKKKKIKMIMTSFNNSKNSSHEKIKINSKKKFKKFNYMIFNNKKQLQAINVNNLNNNKISLNNSTKSNINKNLNTNNGYNYIYNNKIGKIYKKNHAKFINNELFHPDTKKQGINFFMNYIKGANNVLSNGNSCKSINSTGNMSYKKPKIKMSINEIKNDFINKEYNYNINISSKPKSNKNIINSNSSAKTNKYNQNQQTTARSLSITTKTNKINKGFSNIYNSKINNTKHSKKNSINKTKLNLKKYLGQTQKDSPFYKYCHKTTGNYFQINNGTNNTNNTNNNYYKTIKYPYNTKNDKYIIKQNKIININKQNNKNDNNYKSVKNFDNNYNSKMNKILKDSLQEISKIKNDFAKHFTSNNSPNQKNIPQKDSNNNYYNPQISKNISLNNNQNTNINVNQNIKKKKNLIKYSSVKKGRKKSDNNSAKKNIFKNKKQNMKQLTQNNSKINFKKILEPKNQNDMIQIKNVSLTSLTDQYNQTLTHSSRSCIYDSFYYFKESQKLSNYIKNYYAKNKKYPETNLNFYKYGRLIGQGAFGKVNLGLNILTGRVVAIKSFNKKNLNSNSENMKKILYETNLMKKLNHPNITKILELFEDKEYILIIMEYINGGNLFSFLKKRRKVSEKTAKFLFKQIILGIKYMHNQNIVHRDIKLENILIDLNNNIKICDFGIGRVLSSPDQLLFDQCGTPMYIAPEILLSTKENGYKGFPVDIWSSGIALYILLSGSLPFSFKNGQSISIEESKKNDNNNSEELQFSIIHNEPKYIENISDEARELLNGLLNKNPEKRLTCEQILSHPWLKDVNENLNNNKYHLFTKAEMKMLSKTYVDYRKDKNDNLKENFTLSNLFNDDEKIKNNKNEKNIETKSSILAPFNSVNNDDEDDNFYLDEIIMDDFNNKNIHLENGIIAIGNKVKEFNMFYEMNNNCEVDNGIIINSKTNSLTSASNNTINSLTNSFTENYEYLWNPEKNEEKFKNKKIKNNTSIKGTKIKRIINEYKNNKNEENNDKNNILNQLESLGYNKKYVKECIDKNILCHASTAYFLMLNYDKI